jgi:restriction system protein
VGTIPLVKAGWLEKTKNGKWCITPAGRKACLRYTDSQEFFEMSIQLFQEWKANENKRMTQFNSDPYNNALEFSWAQIKQYIEMMDMKDIRTMVASLLKALGCHVAWTATNMEENYPVDIISCMDPLGINSPRLMVHISSSNVVSTSEDIDEFSRALDPNDIGIFISFGGFANKMHEFSIEQKQPLIRLIDLDRFVELWVENQDKIDQAGYSKFPLRPIHFLALPDRF